MSNVVTGPSPDRVMQVGLGFWASKTLLSAVEMGIFTELAHGPEEFNGLAGRLGLHPRAARDFLDALVALGFLHRTQDRYCNAPDADLFLDRNKPSYIGGILEMANARLYGFWNHLTEALRTGQPQNESKSDAGASPFTALYADPARLKAFLAAMSGISHGANLAIARQVPWTKYKTYADLGTAQGDLAVQIALANYPARLESRREEDACIQSLCRAKARRRSSDLRRCDRRRSLEECIRSADEPQYAHRNAGWIRLHRRRLHWLDERGRLPRRLRGAPCGTGFDGRRLQRIAADINPRVKEVL